MPDKSVHYFSSSPGSARENTLFVLLEAFQKAILATESRGVLSFVGHALADFAPCQRSSEDLFPRKRRCRAPRLHHTVARTCATRPYCRIEIFVRSRSDIILDSSKNKRPSRVSDPKPDSDNKGTVKETSHELMKFASSRHNLLFLDSLNLGKLVK